jgi:hypothetical protein
MSACKWRLFVMVGAIGLSTALFVCAPSVAAAGIVTETFSFTASGLDPPGGPVDIQTGSFTLTFDPTLTYVDAPLDAISLTIVGHTYSLSETGFLTHPPGNSGGIAFGGLVGGVNGVQTGTEDFALGGQIDASGNAIPGTWLFLYALASSPNVSWAAGGDIEDSSVLVQSKPASVTSVPEPPTITLLCFALACVGSASRLPRRNLAVGVRAGDQARSA